MLKVYRFPIVHQVIGLKEEVKRHLCGTNFEDVRELDSHAYNLHLKELVAQQVPFFIKSRICLHRNRIEC
jgi:hypothetical protein